MEDQPLIDAVTAAGSVSVFVDVASLLTRPPVRGGPAYTNTDTQVRYIDETRRVWLAQMEGDDSVKEIEYMLPIAKFRQRIRALDAPLLTPTNPATSDLFSVFEIVLRRENAIGAHAFKPLEPATVETFPEKAVLVWHSTDSADASCGDIRSSVLYIGVIVNLGAGMTYAMARVLSPTGLEVSPVLVAPGDITKWIAGGCVKAYMLTREKRPAQPSQEEPGAKKQRVEQPPSSQQEPVNTLEPRRKKKSADQPEPSAAGEATSAPAPKKPREEPPPAAASRTKPTVVRFNAVECPEESGDSTTGQATQEEKERVVATIDAFGAADGVSPFYAHVPGGASSFDPVGVVAGEPVASARANALDENEIGDEPVYVGAYDLPRGLYNDYVDQANLLPPFLRQLASNAAHTDPYHRLEFEAMQGLPALHEIAEDIHLKLVSRLGKAFTDGTEAAELLPPRARWVRVDATASPETVSESEAEAIVSESGGLDPTVGDEEGLLHCIYNASTVDMFVAAAFNSDSPEKVDAANTFVDSCTERYPDSDVFLAVIRNTQTQLSRDDTFKTALITLKDNTNFPTPATILATFSRCLTFKGMLDLIKGYAWEANVSGNEFYEAFKTGETPLVLELSPLAYPKEDYKASASAFVDTVEQLVGSVSYKTYIPPDSAYDYYELVQHARSYFPVSDHLSTYGYASLKDLVAFDDNWLLSNEDGLTVLIREATVQTFLDTNLDFVAVQREAYKLGLDEADPDATRDALNELYAARKDIALFKTGEIRVFGDTDSTDKVSVAMDPSVVMGLSRLRRDKTATKNDLEKTKDVRMGYARLVEAYLGSPTNDTKKALLDTQWIQVDEKNAVDGAEDISDEDSDEDEDRPGDDGVSDDNETANAVVTLGPGKFLLFEAGKVSLSEPWATADPPGHPLAIHVYWRVYPLPLPDQVPRSVAAPPEDEARELEQEGPKKKPRTAGRNPPNPWFASVTGGVSAAGTGAKDLTVSDYVEISPGPDSSLPAISGLAWGTKGSFAVLGTPFDLAGEEEADDDDEEASPRTNMLRHMVSGAVTITERMKYVGSDVVPDDIKSVIDGLQTKAARTKAKDKDKDDIPVTSFNESDLAKVKARALKTLSRQIVQDTYAPTNIPDYVTDMDDLYAVCLPARCFAVTKKAGAWRHGNTPVYSVPTDGKTLDVVVGCLVNLGTSAVRVSVDRGNYVPFPYATRSPLPADFKPQNPSEFKVKGYECVFYNESQARSLSVVTNPAYVLEFRWHLSATVDGGAPEVRTGSPAPVRLVDMWKNVVVRPPGKWFHRTQTETDPNPLLPFDHFALAMLAKKQLPATFDRPAASITLTETNKANINALFEQNLDWDRRLSGLAAETPSTPKASAPGRTIYTAFQGKNPWDPPKPADADHEAAVARVMDEAYEFLATAPSVPDPVSNPTIKQTKMSAEKNVGVLTPGKPVVLFGLRFRSLFAACDFVSLVGTYEKGTQLDLAKLETSLQKSTSASVTYPDLADPTTLKVWYAVALRVATTNREVEAYLRSKRVVFNPVPAGGEAFFTALADVWWRVRQSLPEEVVLETSPVAALGSKTAPATKPKTKAKQKHWVTGNCTVCTRGESSAVAVQLLRPEALEAYRVAASRHLPSLARLNRLLPETYTPDLVLQADAVCANHVVGNLLAIEAGCPSGSCFRYRADKNAKIA